MEKDKLQSQKKWNEMTKKEKAKNIGCLSIIAILVIAAISSLFPGETKEEPYTIPGMEPAPTYLALEQMGFTTERNFGGEYGKGRSLFCGEAGLWRGFLAGVAGYVGG